MLFKSTIREVIRRCLDSECTPELRDTNSIEDHDSEISTLIHDVFGGEILKTYKNNRWHFYNRVDGERVDLASADSDMLSEVNSFEDIPSSTTETSVYFDKFDYSALYLKFVKTLEETMGLHDYSQGYST